MSKKVVFKNIHYSSLSDFYYKNEKEIEVSYSVLLNNFKTGMPIENAIKKQPRKRKESKHGPFLVEGKEYINIPSLAAEYQLNSNTIFKRFERGKRGNDLIPKNKRKNYKPPVPGVKKYKYYIEGKRFNSKPEMCKHFGVNYSTYRRRIENGLSVEEALGIVKVPDRRRVNKKNKENLKASEVDLVVNGKRFESISALAREYNMKDVTLRTRILKQHLSPEEAVSRPIEKKEKFNLNIDGIQYESIAELAKAYDLKPYIIYQRIKKGYSVEEAVTKPTKGKKIKVDGKEFPSIADAARYHDLIPENVQANIKSGMTPEQALGLESTKPLKYEWKNNRFTSIKEMTNFVSAQTDIPKNLLLSRLNRGLTIDEAITLGSDKITSVGRYNHAILKRDEKLANKLAFLYFVEIEIENRLFYKLGITTRNTNERLSNYNYKLISQSKGKLKEIYEFEQMLLKQYQQRKIDKDFDHYLDGITEFLDLLDFEVNEIKSRIEDF